MAVPNPFRSLRQPLLVLTRAIPREMTWVDPLVLLALAGGIYWVSGLASEWTGPLRPTVEIDLHWTALPRYTFFSLARGFVAFVLSTLFTLVYGYVAAKSRSAERVMLPVLDILQSLPVLAFMPGLVLALVSAFPRSNVGLELAAVVMIFTGQAWNMTFSFYHSLRNIPPELVEVSQVYRFGWWRTFRLLELPFSMVGLVWNGMMSMAGGWFFLTINEAFVLGNRDFRLPGIGAYMSVAIERGDTSAMIGAIVAMTTMIVCVDQLFWRPLVAWSEKFNVGDVSSAEVPTSWVLNLLRKSGIIRAVGNFIDGLKPDRAKGPIVPVVRTGLRAQAPKVVQVVTIGLLCVAALAGLFKLFILLHQVSGTVWLEILGKTAATFGRTTIALIVGTLWTVPAGVLIGRNPTLSRVLQPLVQIAASFPAPMIFPLVLAAASYIHVGINYSSVALMVLGTQWYVLFNVIAGAMAIPHDLDEAAVMFHFTRAQKWRRLYLPGIFPHLVTGWVTAAGGAWNASIVGEFQTYQGHELVAYGLGGLIQGATNSGNFPELAAGAVTMAVVVVGINRLVWKRLYHLAEERYALSR